MKEPCAGPRFASYQTTSKGSPAALERPLDEVVVVRRHEKRLRPVVLAEERGQLREEAVERARRVVGVEDRVQVAVQLSLAEDRVDVLRDAQQIEIVRVRVPAARGQIPRELAAARSEAAHCERRRGGTIAEVRACSQKRDDLAVREELGDERVVSIVSLHRC